MKTVKYISVPLILVALFGLKQFISLKPLDETPVGPPVTHAPNTPGPVATGPSDAERRRILTEKINGATLRYYAAEEADTQHTRRQLTRILASAKKEAPLQAAHAAKPFQGVKNATWTVKLGVQQKLGKGEELTTYTEQALRPATGMLSRTQAQMMAAVAGLRDRSAARCNDYRKEILNFADEAELTLAEIQLDPVVFSEVAASINASISNTMRVEIATVLEVALIKSTSASIRKVLRPIIAKAVKTITASGTLVVADGPFPVGDTIAAILAAGGTLWTAYDIHQAVKANKELPNKIEASLQKQLDHLGRLANEAVDQIDSTYSEIYQKPL